MSTKQFNLMTILSLAGAALASTGSVAYATPLKIVNRFDWGFYVFYAEPDSSCPNGLRDHLVSLDPSQSKFVDVNTQGLFFLRAGYLFWGDDGNATLRTASVPTGPKVQSGLWNFVEDGGCTVTDFNGGDSMLKGYQWGSYENLSVGCPNGGTLGIVVQQAAGDGQPETNVVCFVNGPGDGSGGAGGGPS